MEDTELYGRSLIAKHEFDLLEPMKKSRIEVRLAEIGDVEEAYEFCNDKLPGSIASKSIVREVISRNCDNIFIAIHNQRIIGVYALLMITSLGLERLLLGEFNYSKPDPSCLTKTGDVPAGIYVWGLVAPGLAASGICDVSHFLRQPQYQNINLFARPLTEASSKIIVNLGFKSVTCPTNKLFRYSRRVNRDQKLDKAA